MKKNKPDVFAAIGDHNRREILFYLTAGDLSVNSLAGKFKISRPAVSKHLKLLEAAGLISVTDKGRERICALDEKGFSEIKDWLSFYDKFWTKKLTSLENLLKERTKNKK